MSHSGPKSEILENYSLLQVNNLLSLLLQGTLMAFDEPGLLRENPSKFVSDDIKKAIPDILQHADSTQRLTSQISSFVHKKLKSVTTSQLNFAWGNIYKEFFQKGHILDCDNAEVALSLDTFTKSIKVFFVKHEILQSLTLSATEVSAIQDSFLKFISDLDQFKQADSIKAIHNFLHLAKTIHGAQHTKNNQVTIETIATAIAPCLQEALKLTSKLSPILETDGISGPLKAAGREAMIMVCFASVIMSLDFNKPYVDLRDEAVDHKESRSLFPRIIKRPSKIEETVLVVANPLYTKNIKAKQPSLSTLDLESRRKLVADLHVKLNLPAPDDGSQAPQSARRATKSPVPVRRRATGTSQSEEVLSDPEESTSYRFKRTPPRKIGKTPPPLSGNPLQSPSPRDCVYKTSVTLIQSPRKKQPPQAVEDEQDGADTKYKNLRLTKSNSDSD